MRRHYRYGYGRRWHGEWSVPEWAAWHERQRADLSQRFFGLDREVVRAFFTLPKTQLNALFMIYGRRFGSSARSYAEHTYPKWKSGRVTPSADTLVRLLDSVPAVLPLAEKAALVAHLRRRTRRPSHVCISCRLQDVDRVVPQVLTDQFRGGLDHTIPSHLQQALRWLSEDSVRAAERILVAGEAVEAQWLAAAAQVEVDRIRTVAERGFGIEGSLTRNFKHHISTPYVSIEVTILPDSANASARLSLPATMRATSMNDITPARKDDLLGELTKGLSDAEKNELKKVAAREQLALDAKARDAQLKHAASGAEIERAIDAAERLQFTDKGSSFEVSGSFQGASGPTRIEVRRSMSMATGLKWAAFLAAIAAAAYLLAH